MLVTLDDAAPDGRPLTLMAASKETAWGTDEAVFQQVIDSIRFAADAPSPVVGETTDGQLGAGKAELPAGVVGGVVVLGTKPWGSATVTLQEVPPRYSGRAPESPPPAKTTLPKRKFDTCLPA